MIVRQLVALVLSIGLIGCTTMREAERPLPTAATELERRDDVRVTTRAGRTYVLEVTRVDTDAFVGRDDDGKLWKVPFNQIQALEVDRIDVAKTAGATIAGVGVVTVLLWIAGMIVVGQAFEQWAGKDN